jgi:cytoskeleton protein RodZ
VIAIVVLGLVFYGAYRLARSADSLLNEPVAPVPARMAPPVKKPVPKPAAPKAAPPAQAQTSAAATRTETAAERPAPATAADAAMPRPQSAQDRPAVTGVQPSDTDSAAPLPAGHAYGLRNVNSRVFLRAIGTTRVLVQGPDGSIYINRTLSSGDTYRVPDLVGLSLTTSNAGALQLELDGQMMGTAGKSQQIAEALSLDPQAIVDRYNGQ